MAINRASISKELLPGLNAVFGMEYGEVNNEHEPLFEVENSDRAFEEEVLFTGFGTAPTKGEGASVSYDDAQESYTARYTAETVALAFAITEEAMEDNLYDTFAKLASAVSLHIPVDYWAVADRVLSSPGNTQTSAADANPNTNAINATRHLGMVPEGYFINRRFTDTDAWFVKTDVPNGTKMFVRSPLQTKMEPDFDTGNLRFKARERYSFGVSDWRGWFGSAG
jgi:hypothetical protein